MKTVKYIICAAATMLAAGACTKGTPTETFRYGLELSVYNYVFTAEGGELTVDVETLWQDGWEMTLDETKTWLTEKERTGTSVTLAAGPNEGNEAIPEYGIVFKAGKVTRVLTLSQDAPRKTGGEVSIDFIRPPYWLAAISRNGRTILTTSASEDVDGGTDLFLVDAMTQEMRKVGTISEKVEVYEAISDDGSVIAVSQITSSGLPHAGFIKNGVYEAATFPTGFTCGGICDMSADGTIAVGYGMNQFFVAEPIRWVNGVPAKLSRPSKQRVRPTSNAQGAWAVGMDSDGSFIIGRLIGSNEAFYWKPDNTYDWLGPWVTEEKEVQTANGPEVRTLNYVAKATASEKMISSNDKYLAIPYQAWGEGLNGYGLVNVPGLMNLETMEWEYVAQDVVETTPQGGYGISATDNGALFYYGLNMTARVVPKYCWHQGAVTSSREFVERYTDGYFVGDNLSVTKFFEDPLLIIGTSQSETGAMATFIIKDKTE